MTLELLKNQTLAEVGAEIGLEEGKKLIQAFRQSNPDATTGYYIGKNIIEQILSQPDCVGINFRKCLTNDNQEHLVYTGVNSEGKDILEYSVVTPLGNFETKAAIVADYTLWDVDNVDTLLGND